MTDIIIILSKQTAESMLERPVESGRNIEDVLGRFDAKMVSNGQDSDGNTYCRITDVEPEKVDQLLGALQNIAGLEAAYVKPADELP